MDHLVSVQIALLELLMFESFGVVKMLVRAHSSFRVYHRDFVSINTVRANLCRTS
jgi:hypothetical protein